jgi:hypothetical protein
VKERETKKEENKGIIWRDKEVKKGGEKEKDEEINHNEAKIRLNMVNLKNEKKCEKE